MRIMEQLQATQTSHQKQSANHYPARGVRSDSAHAHTLVPCPVWMASDADGAGQAEVKCH